MLRFTYPQDEHARIQFDLARRVAGTSVMQAVRHPFPIRDSVAVPWPWAETGARSPGGLLPRIVVVGALRLACVA